MNFRNRLTLLMILPAFVLTSCGSSSDDARPSVAESVKKQDEFSFSSNPLQYKNTHFDCGDTTQFDALFNIYSYENSGIVLNDKVSLEALYDGSPVVKRADSKFINSTIYGREMSDTYKLVFNDDNQIIGGTNVSGGVSGGPLKICGNQLIERESVQHIAADILTSLDLSFHALELTGKANKVLPITVFTHPIVSTTYEYYHESSDDMVYSEKSVMTDNAFYYNSGLYFIPHSKEFKNYLGDKHVDYWEIPFVASHEYGHHIFASFFPESQGQLNLKATLKHTCFEGHKELNRVLKNTSGSSQEAFSQRQVTTQDVLSSFNEGFADLFAYFTLDKAKASLDGIFGFDDEREVDSLFFANFKVKAFSKEVAEVFFSTYDYSQSSTLGTFQDTHTIGAIAAARINLILEKAQLTNVMKLNVILDWLELMNAEFDAKVGLEVEEYMFEGLNAFKTVFLRQVGQEQLTAEQLKDFQEAFPYYAEKF
ncbi:hypothetical protein [Bacteriovorax sp. Seq25_V]|uniref:hypothetical protein n=1 Tax=Bacteriovorax sp. Seq25_V TaxID=1201288 RepID=UPI00038A3718|nr:hypothetical protein [Bacteriovorax sp. Seq25_V]EQC46060.1 putative lipoprotein [Bacteriovorax sp. Seq25_V]